MGGSRSCQTILAQAPAELWHDAARDVNLEGRLTLFFRISKTWTGDWKWIGLPKRLKGGLGVSRMSAYSVPCMNLCTVDPKWQGLRCIAQQLVELSNKPSRKRSEDGRVR